MNDLKKEHITIAKKVWELYMSGMDKSAISIELDINRAEVTHVIKYTTQTLYLDDREFENLVNSLLAEKDNLVKELEEYKYSNLDAYINKETTGKKLTYKRLFEIYLEKNKELTQKLEVYASSKISLFGKNIL